LQQAKSQLAEAQKALAAGRQELANTKRQVAQSKRQQGAELTRLDRDVEQKLLEVGQAVDGARPNAAPFAELFAQIDAIRGGVEQRRGHAAQLSAARERYDRSAFKNGLIVLAGGAGLLLVGLLVLVLVFAL
jgi:hypothetical protein